MFVLLWENHFNLAFFYFESTVSFLAIGIISPETAPISSLLNNTYKRWG